MGQAGTTTAASPFPVLVVEPDAAIRRGIVRRLRTHPGPECFYIVEADSFPSACACLDEQRARFELGETAFIVTEVDLPLAPQGGLTFIEQVRQSPATQHLICVILTTCVDIATKVRGICIAQDYLIKPAGEENLVNHLLRLRLIQRCQDSAA